MQSGNVTDLVLAQQCVSYVRQTSQQNVSRKRKTHNDLEQSPIMNITTCV
jgi:hypothetical protein